MTKPFAARAAACAMLVALSSSALAQSRTGPPARSAPATPSTAKLQLVASFDHQVTGVAVAKDGRTFVNFPRWTEDSPVIADALWTSSKGQFFVTSPEDDSVKLRVAEGQLVDAVKDKRLNWPDSLAEGPDGSIFVTGSAIPDSRMFKLNAPVAIKSELWTFQPPR